MAKETKKKKPSPKKKSSTKKTTTKKAPKKKATKTKKAPKKQLVHAHGPEAFWVANGMILHNLLDLADALSGMADDHYYYHAEGEQNDFSIWITEVLCDEDCANSLHKAKTRKNATTAVKRHLKVYSL